MSPNVDTNKDFGTSFITDVTNNKHLRQNKVNEEPCLLHYLPFNQRCLFNHRSLPETQ